MNKIFKGNIEKNSALIFLLIIIEYYKFLQHYFVLIITKYYIYSQLYFFIDSSKVFYDYLQYYFVVGWHD